MRLNKSNKRRYISEETRKKLSLAWKRRAKPSEETRKKISLAKKGIKLSDETRKKMSLSLIASWIHRKEAFTEAAKEDSNSKDSER